MNASLKNKPNFRADKTGHECLKHVSKAIISDFVGEKESEIKIDVFEKSNPGIKQLAHYKTLRNYSVVSDSMRHTLKG